jgi:hypothetical protein
MFEFLKWVDSTERSYDDAMEAWQTSCPRSSVWEDASIAGYVTLEQLLDVTVVTLTARGRAIIDAA